MPLVVAAVLLLPKRPPFGASPVLPVVESPPNSPAGFPSSFGLLLAVAPPNNPDFVAFDSPEAAPALTPKRLPCGAFCVFPERAVVLPNRNPVAPLATLPPDPTPDVALLPRRPPDDVEGMPVPLLNRPPDEGAELDELDPNKPPSFGAVAEAVPPVAVPAAAAAVGAPNRDPGAALPNMLEVVEAPGACPVDPKRVPEVAGELVVWAVLPDMFPKRLEPAPPSIVSDKLHSVQKAKGSGACTFSFLNQTGMLPDIVSR